MRRLLFENFGLKVLALLIAFALWAYVGTRQVLERRTNLRVELTDVPAGMAVDSAVRTYIPVVLTGRKDTILDIDTDELKAVVSLRGYDRGERQLVIRPHVHPLPEGVSVSVPDITVHLSPIAPSGDTGGKKKKRNRS